MTRSVLFIKHIEYETGGHATTLLSHLPTREAVARAGRVADDDVVTRRADDDVVDEPHGRRSVSLEVLRGEAGDLYAQV